MSTSRRPGPSVRLRITEVKGAMRTQHEDRVVTEEPLEIRLAEPRLPPGRVSVTMRTPGHDFELAAGWLFHEGVVASVDDLSSVAYCTDVALTPEQELNVVTATLRVPARRTVGARYGGMTAASSACGVCGTETIDEVFATLADRVSPAVGPASPGTSYAGCRRRCASISGCSTAPADCTPRPLSPTATCSCCVRTWAGTTRSTRCPASGCCPARSRGRRVLVVSGRIGFEIVQKAVASGVAALVAVGAPTSLAVGLAERAGLMVLGWTRDDRTVVYTGAERLVT